MGNILLINLMNSFKGISKGRFCSSRFEKFSSWLVRFLTSNPTWLGSGTPQGWPFQENLLASPLNTKEYKIPQTPLKTHDKFWGIVNCLKFHKRVYFHCFLFYVLFCFLFLTIFYFLFVNAHMRCRNTHRQQITR